MNFAEMFMECYKRPATPLEVLEHERWLHIFNTTPDDSLFSMLVALGYTRSVMETMPSQMRQAVVDVATELRGTANIEIERTRTAIDKIAEDNKGVVLNAVREGATKAIADVAQEIVLAGTHKSVAKWALGALGAAVLVVLGSAGAGFNWGHQSAKNEAAAAAAWMATAGGQNAMQAYTNDPARAEWAGTKEARSAYVLYRTGELTALAECNKQGWAIEKKGEFRYCYPRAVKTGVYGWALP